MPALDWPVLDFRLPPGLEADAPPEARGLPRDGVRLLVSRGDGGEVEHRAFVDLPDVLRPGDLLVANDSATLPAAVAATRSDGGRLTVHFSTRLAGGVWVVEPRRAADGPDLADLAPGARLRLSGGAWLRLLAPYAGSARLWLAQADDADVPAYLRAHGRPIAYPYVRGQWPIAAYQTVYAVPGTLGSGSAEMPSAGRAFSPDVLERLAHRGVGFATLTLHAGVASLESPEPPYPEEYRVPPATAEAVRAARAEGRRVLAVGTTVVRALEAAAEVGDGAPVASHGWADVVVTPERGVRVVDGLLTGFHEPRASHLAMLEAMVGRRHLARAYAAALDGRYLWHEFGDLHLLLPGRGPDRASYTTTGAAPGSRSQ